MTRQWIWKSAVAGLCGSAAHSLLMYFKARSGLLPSFQPYESLQLAIRQWSGADVPAALPWLLSFLNGSMVLGLVFARIYRWLPGRNGAAKGLVFGLFGWGAMGLVFFPLLGLGIFALDLGLGIQPALFSLAMVLAYSLVMGVVYATLDPAAAD